LTALAFTYNVFGDALSAEVMHKELGGSEFSKALAPPPLSLLPMLARKLLVVKMVIHMPQLCLPRMMSLPLRRPSI